MPGTIHMIWHTVQYVHFYHPFEKIDTILRVEGEYDRAYNLFCCVEVAVNQIPKKYGHLVQ